MIRAFDEHLHEQGEPPEEDFKPGIPPPKVVKPDFDAGIFDDDRDDQLTFLLMSVDCGMLPGSTRLMVTTFAPVGEEDDDEDKPWTAAEVALALPSAGVLGCNEVTVSTFGEGIVGAAAGGGGLSGETVTVDASGRRLLSAPAPVTPFPTGVWVSSVAILNADSHLRGVGRAADSRVWTATRADILRRSVSSVGERTRDAALLRRRAGHRSRVDLRAGSCARPTRHGGGGAPHADRP